MSNKTDIRIDIKNMFKGYRKMTKSLRRKLRSLGFTVLEGGKHYKLYYLDDFNHPITLSKTASDSRTGLNISSALIHAVCA